MAEAMGNVKVPSVNTPESNRDGCVGGRQPRVKDGTDPKVEEQIGRKAGQKGAEMGGTFARFPTSVRVSETNGGAICTCLTVGRLYT